VGGHISGNSGEVYIGVGKVDKRRFRLIVAPLGAIYHFGKRAAAAHPLIASTVMAAVVVVGGTGLALHHTPASSPLSRLVGSWQGTYTCAQGLTGLTLHITPKNPKTDAVRLDFYAVPTNPSVPTGSATFEATVSGGDIHLTPVAWISQPSGYMFVDFVGPAPASGSDTFDGTVTTCGEPFDLHRT
jgi:hypothetical protein